MSSPPDPFQPLLVQASDELQAGRQPVAEGIYREILGHAPGHPVATHFLGVCLVQTGRAQEGLDALARSMQLRSGTRRGSVITTRSCSRRRATLRPPSASWRRRLRSTRAMSRHTTTSAWFASSSAGSTPRATAYEAALALAPDDPFVATNYGSCLAARGEFEEAIGQLRRSVARAPRNPVAHNNLGSALNAVGDLRGAIAAYRKAIEVEPRYTPAWFNLGLGLRETGDDVGSLKALRQAVQVGPDFAPAWQAFAYAFAKARFLAWDAQAAEDLTRVLLHPSIDPGPLAEAAASLLRARPDVRPAVPRSAGGRRALHALAHPMLLALIENALVPDPAFEAFLRTLRPSPARGVVRRHARRQRRARSTSPARSPSSAS